MSEGYVRLSGRREARKGATKDQEERLVYLTQQTAAHCLVDVSMPRPFEYGAPTQSGSELQQRKSPRISSCVPRLLTSRIPAVFNYDPVRYEDSVAERDDDNFGARASYANDELHIY